MEKFKSNHAIITFENKSLIRKYGFVVKEMVGNEAKHMKNKVEKLGK